MRRLIGTLALCIVFVAPVVCEEVKEEDRPVYKGIVAFKQGDYETAWGYFFEEAVMTVPPHPHAAYSLGFMAEKGLGGPKPKDPMKTALKYYRQAAQQDYGPAQRRLAKLYYLGQGVVQNYKESHKWALKAALNKDPEAMSMLGALHYQGYGAEKDYILAHMFFNLSRAYSNGTDQMASEFLDLLNSQMTTSQINKAQDRAIQWMAKHRKAGITRDK